MNLARWMCVLTIAAGLAIATSPLQAMVPTQTKVTVPFEFQAGGQILPAGSYYISNPTGAGLIYGRSTSGEASFTSLSTHVGPAHGASNPQVVFVKKNGKYFLSEIWFEGHSGGQALNVK